MPHTLQGELIWVVLKKGRKVGVTMKEKKRNGSLLVLLVAIALAVAAGFLAYQYLDAEKTAIYLFADNYPAGKKITSDMLILTEVDKSMIETSYSVMDGDGGIYIHPGNIGQIEGAFLKSNVVKGTPFMSTQTAEFGGPSAEARLSPNKVAVTIPADALSATIMDIDEGSRVNLYISYTFQRDEVQEQVTLAPLQNVKVLQAARTDEDRGGELRGVTVEVSPEESAMIAYGINYGTIWMGLVKPGEYKESNIPPYTLNHVIEEVEKSREQQNMELESDATESLDEAAE